MTIQTNAEEIKVLFPKQYIGKWKNDEGIRLNVIQYVALEELELKKIFIPVEEFRSLELKSKLGKELIFSIVYDEEDRPQIKAVKEVDKKK